MSETSAEPTLPVEEKWLVDIINKKTPSAEGVLRGYKCSTIGENKGFMSVITRVMLDWDPEKSKGIEDLPKGVICKQPTNTKIGNVSEDMAAFMTEKILSEIHNRECNAYEVLTDRNCDIPIARCFHVEKMTKIGEGMIVLEDLTDKAKSVGFGEHLTKEQAMALMEHYGSLQAYGLNHPEYREKLDVFDMAQFADFFDKIEGLMGQVNDIFPDFPFSPEKITQQYNDAKKVLDISKGILAVLSLGDVQPNNILWERCDTDREKASDKVCAFIDFQGAGPNVASNDIGTTVTMGLTAETRRANEDEMLDRYWKSLQENLTAEGKQRCTMTLAEVRRLYRVSVFMSGIFMAPMLLEFMKKMGLGDQFKKESKDRMIAAIEDFEKP